MIVDSSALIAVLFKEPDWEQLLLKINESTLLAISAANYFEASIVFDSRTGGEEPERLDRFISTADVSIVPVTVGQVRIAREAYCRYGRGNHPASLNFGDCFVTPLRRRRASSSLQGHGFRAD